MTLGAVIAMQEHRLRHELARRNVRIACPTYTAFCVKCRRCLPMEGKRVCGACFSRVKVGKERQRAQLRAEGRCYRCREFTYNGKTHCGSCTALRAQTRREGQCHTCSRQATPGYSRCGFCREKHAARQRHEKQGLPL